MPMIWILGLAALLRVAVAVWNTGFIAIDDYDVNISRFIPYQRTSLQDILDASLIRSPLPNLVFRSFAGLAYRLGWTGSLDQYRFTCAVLGVLSLAAVWTAWRLFQEQGREWEGLVAAALVAFGFLNPLFSTRVLIEGAATPFLALSLLYASRYWRHPSASFNLVASLSFLALASVFRFQSGVCAGALLALVVHKKDWRGALVFVSAGLVLFAITGGLDYWVRGEFHGSLRRYLSYNLQFASAHYGTSPFYLYGLLFLGLSFPPTFLSRYKNFAFAAAYRPLVPALLYFGVFVGIHSLIGHKEERFMVTVLPIFLILLVPLLHEFWRQRSQRWRVLYFAILNGVLLVPASFSVPQNNIIAAARFVDGSPQIKQAVSLENTLDYLFPLAFIERKFPMPLPLKLERLDSFLKEPFSDSNERCSRVFFVRQDLLAGRDLRSLGLESVETFRPGPLEALVVRLNPRKNARRSAVEAFAPQGCRYR